jgi:hypothetical protein
MERQFNFSIPWDDLDPEAKAEFKKVCISIENSTIKRLAAEYNLPVKIVRKTVTKLDIQEEWEDMNENLPERDNWIVFEMQFMREDLINADLI